MDLDRRRFLQFGLAAASVASPFSAEASQSPGQEPAPTGSAADPDHVGVLNDTTLCIGCRECEAACNRRNHLPRTATPFSDRNVLRTVRRPSETAFTVVNQFAGSPSPDQAALPQTYCKVQCMHCLHPSCVSACIVGAMTKAPDGSVVYNPTICLGCRYCQIACPFEVPAYEFNEPIMPRVRKCELCTDRAKGTGANPACAASCPTEALVFGRRADLVAMAKERIARRPDRYVNHLYGEFEVGGTSWMYLVGRPVEEVGLVRLPETPPPERTEAIQHGIFTYGIIPVTLYGALAGIMWLNHRKYPEDDPGIGEASEPPADSGPGGEVRR
jgi:Fe-S-cluster-containing dehydrogenase component